MKKLILVVALSLAAVCASAQDLSVLSKAARMAYNWLAEEGYKRLDIKSGGADTPRPITLRLKPSTGQWFLWEQIILVGIRVPVSQDPWA